MTSPDDLGIPKDNAVTIQDPWEIEQRVAKVVATALDENYHMNGERNSDGAFVITFPAGRAVRVMVERGRCCILCGEFIEEGYEYRTGEPEGGFYCPDCFNP